MIMLEWGVKGLFAMLTLNLALWCVQITVNGMAGGSYECEEDTPIILCGTPLYSATAEVKSESGTPTNIFDAPGWLLSSIGNIAVILARATALDYEILQGDPNGGVAASYLAAYGIILHAVGVIFGTASLIALVAGAIRGQ